MAEVRVSTRVTAKGSESGSKAKLKEVEQLLDKAMQEAGLTPTGPGEANFNEFHQENTLRKEYTTPK